MAGMEPSGLSISYCSTVVRNWPMGGRFSTEQLTVQAWQPMHLRMSTSMPKRLPSMPGRRGGWVVPGRLTAAAGPAAAVRPKAVARPTRSCKKVRLPCWTAGGVLGRAGEGVSGMGNTLISLSRDSIILIRKFFQLMRIK